MDFDFAAQPTTDDFGFDAIPMNENNNNNDDNGLDSFAFMADIAPVATASSPSNASNNASFTPEPVAPQQVSLKAEWEAKKKQELTTKRAEQQAQYQANLKDGAQELKKFEQDRKQKIAQKKQTNRTEEKNNQEQQADKSNPNAWVRVSSMCNLKPLDPKKAAEQNNNERMRKLMVDLKNEGK